MERLPRAAQPALALLAGLAHAMALALPGSGQPQWWLQLAALAVLAALVQRAGTGRAAMLGWAYATAWLAGTFWWLYISMHVYGGLPALMAAAAVLLLAAFLGGAYALAMGLFARLASPGAGWNALLFGALWMGAELARGTLFTGFPWGAAGYAHVDGPLAALAPVIGVYGISAVAAAAAYGLAMLSHAAVLRSWRYWTAVAVAAGLLAACNVVGRPAQADAAPPMTVALLQGNIPQDEKFESGTGIPFALAWYQRELRQATASLVVAPETALPLLPQQLPEGYMEALQAHFRGGRQAALIGAPLGGFSQGYSNAVIGLAPGIEGYRYLKHHLVPFGEFVPPFFRWFTRMMNIPLGDFNRGALAQPSLPWQGERLAPNICYEDLFGEELARRFADPSTAPTVFVNVSNIAWFGNTLAIDQHLHISRMRALEFDRPMLRATNTGATVVIDRHGRVTHALERHTRGVLTGQVHGGRAITPFAWWAARFGLWPLTAAVAAAIAVAWGLRRRRHA